MFTLNLKISIILFVLHLLNPHYKLVLSLDTTMSLTERERGEREGEERERKGEKNHRMKPSVSKDRRSRDGQKTKPHSNMAQTPPFPLAAAPDFLSLPSLDLLAKKMQQF